MKVPLFLMLLFGILSISSAITLTTFDPSVVFYGTTPANVAQMDSVLGLYGFTIEDFEDANLVAGLSIIYNNRTESNVVLSTNLDPRALWDGSKSLLTDMSSGIHNTFKVSGGVSSFGIGVGDVEGSNLRLYVNDIDFGLVKSLPNYRRTIDDSREIYIRIDAGAGELIHSVRFSGVTSTDGIFYDHVAFAVPEPSTYLLLVLGILFAGFRSIRK